MSKEVNEERTPRTVEDVKEMLSKHSNGEIQRTIQNCITILQNDHVLADAIRLNLLSERIDIVKPVGWPRSGKTLNDTDMKYILRRMEKYGISSEKKIESAIRIVANENRYHPIRDYLNGLKWDGTERIAHVLHHFLGAAEDEYTCEAMKIFLLGAIKRVFQPGCKFEIMLCLVGGQGAGKSTFFRLLAVKDEWFSDDLRRLDDDNVYRKLQGHWIIEMSEMIATANAKSIEEIKSFLSKQKETYKVPYETHPADRLRQCVFAGTTNRQDFLPRDRTGNRRFIPVPVDAELAEVHILDNEEESRTYIDQLWAEAMTIYNRGNYKLAFSPAMQETLQAHQQDFMQEDAQAGMIYAFLEDYTGDRVCSKQLYAEALGNTNIPAESIAWMADNVKLPIFADPVSTAKAVKLKPVLGKLHTLKPNRIEAELLSGVKITDDASLQKAAETLLDTGLHRVFISLGSDGVFAADRSGQQVQLPPLPGAMVNTTGCGDAFMAAITWAYLQGTDLTDTAKAGLAASVIAMESAETINPAMSEDTLRQRAALSN